MLKILNEDFKPIRAIKKISSMQWTKRFYEPGSFEFHVNELTVGTEELVRGRLIEHDGHTGIILYRESFGADIKICGYTLQGILKSRKCVGRKTGFAETVMKDYVRENLVEAEDSKRNIPNFMVEASSDLGEEITWDCEKYKLDQEISQIGKENEIGYDVVLEDSRLVFKTRKGIDRTATQKERPAVIFSQRRKNIADRTYTEDGLTAYNTVYIGETAYSHEEYSGLDRWEGYEKEETSKKTEDGTTEEETSTKIEGEETESEETVEKWKTLLDENSVKESIEATVNGRMQYGKDYELGDYVTVQVEAFNGIIEKDLQVTEVLLVYEHGNKSVTPTFGEKKKSIIRKMIERS